MSVRERIENLVESFMEYGALPLLLATDVPPRDFPREGSVPNTINPSATIDAGNFSTKSIIAGEAVLSKHQIALIFVCKHFTERIGSPASLLAPANAYATGCAKFLHIVNNAKSKGLPLVTFYDDGTVIAPTSEKLLRPPVGRRKEKGESEKLPTSEQEWLPFIQLANIVTALEELSAENVPHIAVLTLPYRSSGFITSFPLGDIVLAEPKPADSKILKKNNHKYAPEGQTFQLATGEAVVPCEDNLIDMYVPRKKLKETLDTLLSFFVPS